MIALLVVRSAAIFLIVGLVFGGMALAHAADQTPQSQSAEHARMTGQSDIEALKSIPLIAVIERAAGGYTLLLPTPDVSAPAIVKENAEKARARIDALDPDLRRLVWLTWILQCWGPEKNEGLHTFFYLWGGDYASQTLDALEQSGLSRQAAIFRAAMAAFGPTYPTDRTIRERFFAWSQPATRIDETTSIPQPLNAFDYEIMALSAAFGSRDDYGQAIEDVVRNSPNLLAWADKARDTLSDDERLRWLIERLSRLPPRWVARKFAPWPAAYRQLYLLDLFNSEMLNGGVHQFFANSSGDLAQEVVIALRQANLPKHADAVQKGVEMFASPYPVDRQIRSRYFFVNGETTEWDNKLDALTAEVDDGAIGAAMLAIAKRDGLLPK